MSPNRKLQTALTRLKLRRLAGAKGFELGSEYFSARRVLEISEKDGKITGVVRGTTEYDVTLCVEGDVLAFDCTCPMGAEGGFCKHCVALGLAWLTNGGNRNPSNKNPAAPPPTMSSAEVQAWLTKKDKSALIEIILSRAAQDARFRNQLLLHIANSEKEGQ